MNKITSIPDNNTLVEMNLLVKATETGLKERTILDEKIDIAYLWAGGSMDSDGMIYNFTFSLGPYVAYWEYSPVKVNAELELDTGFTTTKNAYVTIPNLELELEM